MWNDSMHPQYRQAGRVQPGGAKPLVEAVRLAEYIRYELGREGVRQFLLALCPLIPRDFLSEIADALGEAIPDPPPAKPEAQPPEPPPKQPQKPAGMGAEELMLLMQAMQGGRGNGGLDPRILMKLLGKAGGGKD